MALTPVRHVRVADPLWDAAKAKAAAEYRTVADVITECLRNYVEVPGSHVRPDTGRQHQDGERHAAPGREPPPPELPLRHRGRGKAAAMEYAREAAAERAMRSEDVAPVVPQAVPEAPATVTAAAPGKYPCCKHCKGSHGGHGDPCMNGCS